jgi:hypothetical protein
MRLLTRWSVAALALLLSAAPLHAQRYSDDDDNARWLDQCQNNWNSDRDRGRACEVRTVPVRLSGRAIEIDGRENGGIKVRGWNGDSVRVTARIQAWDDDDASAANLIKEIRFSTDGRRVRAEGPSGGWHRRNWSVSYMVWVPRNFDLTLDANNGGLGVTGVRGKIDLRTTNGGVSLDDVGGDVHARTQNGGLNVSLVGSQWEGTGLDAETQNGGVRVSIPEKYAATLETGTVNGSMQTDFPITVQGRISRRLTLPLNGGGKTIRAMTTNGGVRLTAR